MSLKITIPGNPPTKKTSQKIIVNRATGRPMVIPSKEYLAYERFCCGTKTKGGWLDSWGNIEPINFPVNLKAVYWLENRRPKDLLNLLAATADILEKAGIIINDRLIVSLDGSCIAGVNKDRPRVEIELKEAP